MSVTREDVFWCYRNILDRDPESEQAVTAHLPIQDFKQLVLILLSSEEFQSSLRNVKLSGFGAGLSLPPVLDRLTIDVQASAAELKQCAAKIKAAWEHLGVEKAHWSVLSNDAFLPDNLAASIDSFWASGEIEVSQVIRALGQYVSGQLGDGVCVEYGCGTGRLTSNFAKQFKVVHAYDISRIHLEHARARAAAVGVANIEFHECAQDFRVAITPCDFFYSRIVLQHNPPPVILELIRIALTQLNPGGIAMFQVPTYIVGYRFKLSEWLAMDHKLDMQMHCLPQEAISRVISSTGCRLLSLREDDCSSAENGIVSNTYFCQK